MKIATAALGMVLLSTSTAFSAGFEVLKPHRAVYDVTLDKAEDRSGIQGMSGRIVYEMRGNECEGISIRYRFVTSINAGRDQFVTDQQTATYESPDGREFSFQTKSFVNQQPDQNVSGHAVLDEDSIKVTFKGDKPYDLKLGEGVFTSTHLVDILEEAARGTSFISHDVFDGSGNADKILNSASVIGKPKLFDETLAGEEGGQIQSLRKKRAWPITMSYFNKDTGNTGEGVPVYEASFLLYEDGITRQLMMRYPDYALRASLKELKYYESVPCKLEN